MSRLANLLAGAGLGAGLMYLFDPDRGNRRRSLFRDQVRRAMNKSARGADTTYRDAQHRILGTFAELRSLFTHDDASDDVLVSRVRSKMGRYISHPAAIEVTAHNGLVMLRGPILAHEVDDLLCAVKSVRGIGDIVNQLEVHDRPGNIAALQGGGQRRGEPNPIMRSYWSPTTRVAAGALGGAMMINCLTRRTPLGVLIGPAGLALMLRALTNLETKRLLGIRGRRGVDVHKTITIERPVAEVFDLLANPARYSEFSDIITSVEDEGHGCYRKTVAGPAGAEMMIHERITQRVPNEYITFRSEPDSMLQYAGCACFVPIDENTTKVEIQATYNPPGGALAHGVAWLAGLDPKSLMDDIMARAKSYLESGKQPHDAAGRKFHASV
jgi:uncharacterized membrane protein